MKKSIKIYSIFILILLVFLSLSSINAEDEELSVNDHTFNVPDKYEVDLHEESNYLLLSEESHTFIYINNKENILDQYTSQDYTTGEEKTFSLGDKNVVETFLTKENSTLYVYSVEGYDNVNVIVRTEEDNWDVESPDNPVNSIITSLK